MARLLRGRAVLVALPVSRVVPVELLPATELLALVELATAEVELVALPPELVPPLVALVALLDAQRVPVEPQLEPLPLELVVQPTSPLALVVRRPELVPPQGEPVVLRLSLVALVERPLRAARTPVVLAERSPSRVAQVETLRLALATVELAVRLSRPRELAERPLADRLASPACSASAVRLARLRSASTLFGRPLPTLAPCPRPMFAAWSSTRTPLVATSR